MRDAYENCPMHDDHNVKNDSNGHEYGYPSFIVQQIKNLIQDCLSQFCDDYCMARHDDGVNVFKLTGENESRDHENIRGGLHWDHYAKQITLLGCK